MIHVRLVTPATFAILVTLGMAVIPAILAIIVMSGNQYLPVVKQPGRLPRASLQVQQDFSSRKSLGRHPRCLSRLHQLNLRGALSTLRQASCSR